MQQRSDITGIKIVSYRVSFLSRSVAVSGLYSRSSFLFFVNASSLRSRPAPSSADLKALRVMIKRSQL